MVPFSVKEGDKYVSYKTWAEFKVGLVCNQRACALYVITAKPWMASIAQALVCYYSVGLITSSPAGADYIQRYALITYRADARITYTASP